MTLRLVIDMNLSPDWVPALAAAGWPAVHWSVVGDGRATDRMIMDWAKANDYVVLTHDLDFGTLLALTHARGPSVIQIRGQNVLPDYLSPLVLESLRQHADSLLAGALMVIDDRQSRVRLLPIRR
jgi:predicted nuclease of predicted toxin-antitoxin system